MGNPFLAKSLNQDSVLRIFCLPYAGAGSSRYFRWSSYFPADVEICPVLLPGREGRLREQPFNDLQSLVHTIADALAGAIDRPFALFGHSMGALISFELARCFRRELNVLPFHLFASGHRAPQLPDPDPHVHRLPDAQFCERVRRIGGATEAVLDHRELMALMLPMLRADFELCETYTYYPERPLECPISAFGGLDDATTPLEHLSAWEQQTDDSLVLRMFAGGHLFLNDCEADVVQSVLDDLNDTLVRRG
jgi:medium-chain acyl-[acyl-carrier-protein] hydrolase